MNTTKKRSAYGAAALILLSQTAWSNEADPSPVVTAEAITELKAQPVAVDKPTWLGAYLVGQFGEAKGRIDSMPGDDKSLSYRVGAGYRFNDYIALEASFIDVGRYQASGMNLKGYGGTLGIQARLPLGAIYGPIDDTPSSHPDSLDRLALYVRGEAVALRVTPGGLPSDDSVSPGWAAGLEYALDKGVILRGEYQRIDIDYTQGGLDESVTLDVVSVGVSKLLSY